GRYGAMPHSWTVDKVGAMAHSARDCAIVLEAISGADVRDPASGRRRFRLADVARVQSAITGLRVGFAAHDFEEEAAPPIRPALREGWQAILDLGVAVREAA